MIFENLKNGKLTVNPERGTVSALTLGESALSAGEVPLFSLRLVAQDGSMTVLDTAAATICRCDENDAVYSGFSEDVQVRVSLRQEAAAVCWEIAVENRTDMAIEWVEFPKISLGKLRANGGEGSLLLPYNEGALIEDAYLRDTCGFCGRSTEYPSHGSYYIFPHMMSAQFMAYLTANGGLYMGAHDEKRCPKGLDFLATDDGVVLELRHFTGADFGEDFTLPYPVVTRLFDGGWEDAAEIYRDWFETHLPPRAQKAEHNPALPAWYGDAPVVVTYPVRGIHDMDEMQPNALFPYINALPLIEELAQRTNHRILVVLMHWEGTAPWAPPYVWPPYGGEECFDAFLQGLHEKGHLLGVYCSGFGWTLKSNLIDSYDNTAQWATGEPEALMCAGPDSKVQLSNICTAQRSGYDLCPAAAGTRDVLREAYLPLFRSGIDYAQILDQNHGGAQYFCYSREHGHPPMPGAWMTENMQALLSEWNSLAPETLFGCESAAAEPFMGNLLLSDNRFELNFQIGRAVPLYAYLYHEYLHNFMGNQVCCPFDIHKDSMRLRMAYAFVNGDLPTLVLRPDGELMNHWGCRDFSVAPDRDAALTMLKNAMALYKGDAKNHLLYGRMVKAKPFTCEQELFTMDDGREMSFPAVLTAAYTYEGKTVQVLLNHTNRAVECRFDDRTLTIPALQARVV